MATDGRQREIEGDEGRESCREALFWRREKGSKKEKKKGRKKESKEGW